MIEKNLDSLTSETLKALPLNFEFATNYYEMILKYKDNVYEDRFVFQNYCLTELTSFIAKGRSKKSTKRML